MKRIAIIEAPSILGLKDTGVDGLPRALLATGLAARLQARLAGVVPPPPYDVRRDPVHGLLNAASIATYSRTLADAVGRVLDAGEYPLVLGGDCSIVLGTLLALRRRGRFGLFFADGHADFYQPEANVNGEAASSDLALATGRGPSLLTAFEGHERLVRDEDVAVFGYRDAGEQREYGSQPLPPSIFHRDLAQVRRGGIAEAAATAVQHLCRPEIPGFWFHLDADVLSDAIMPAVDYRLPDGLTWEELTTLLEVAHRSGRVIGLEITIYNPRLDPGGVIARDFMQTFVPGMLAGVI